MDNHSNGQFRYLYVPGATTVGVVCSDGVILASEKRVSYGGLVLSRAGKKVFKIADHIGSACAGLVSDMQMLIREVAFYANLFRLEARRPIGVRAAAKVMSNLLFSRRLVPLLTQTIVGGVDDEGPSLYVLDVLGSVIPDKYAAVGSGAEIALGVLEEGYKDGLTIEEGKELVVRAIKSAVSRDAMSGDGIDFIIITKNGIKEESMLF
ncbi:archaeal proteasome endopeptidase complex subunit beta [Candidatus Bathyarchaeota archaeon]|nr:MAG: proteasome endopeptidase complex, archaeal, beta subunit [Candidatus Bathyarchaeota archaeon ex4484_40]RJS67733.1 MAG: archaeal proteasome endopeptidase complex subunit beta [Candidatus Bathyarchaeota archaeon]RJS78574.1 MAG: archaeal proteasome endopeptidase complex subunit beta [Candidatus Bathyarchaeota archaeon]